MIGKKVRKVKRKIKKERKRWVNETRNNNQLVLENKETEEKTELKLKDNIYLVDKDGLVYAYDTKLEKMVFINSNSRIFMIADDVED